MNGNKYLARDHFSSFQLFQVVFPQRSSATYKVKNGVCCAHLQRASYQYFALATTKLPLYNVHGVWNFTHNFFTREDTIIRNMKVLERYSFLFMRSFGRTYRRSCFQCSICSRKFHMMQSLLPQKLASQLYCQTYN